MKSGRGPETPFSTLLALSSEHRRTLLLYITYSTSILQE